LERNSSNEHAHEAPRGAERKVTRAPCRLLAVFAKLTHVDQRLVDMRVVLRMEPAMSSSVVSVNLRALAHMRSFHALIVLVTLACWPAAPAAAQEEPSGTSYITPFPEADIYKLQAYGDAFAEGVLGALVESFAGDTRVQVSRKHVALPGITRLDFEEQLRAEEANRDTLHIGVIMLGIGDRNSIRLATGKRAPVGSEEWRDEFGRRADRLIKTLKKRGIALYWIGLPVLRRSDANDDAQMTNDIVREKAYLNGVKYVDIQAQFADENGNYTPYGPDLTGKNRLLREADGVQFTAAGNRKLAHFVEQEIKRDLAQAKNERAIPLAGGEAEQKRIAAFKRRSTASESDSSWKSTIAVPKDPKADQQKAKAPAAPQTSVAEAAGEQKADNGRITLKSIGATGREETVTLDLPRPAIPSAVIALMTRRESSDRPSQMGDVVAEDVGGGLVVLNSVSPSGIAARGSRRGAPTQSAYYHVLIKGERLPPKPGRADDFAWPKIEPEIMIEPAPERRLGRPTSQRMPPRS
jgi:hypothetical protein